MTTFRILQGDAMERLRELPADSIQCVATSPPYWGLRDYKLKPMVWGGQAECQHEWGEIIAVNATNHTDKRRWNHTRNGRDEVQPTEKRVAWLRSKVGQGAFCRHCNAWRGSLGLEPTPELYVDHMVAVFREVRRVLRGDGVCFLNMGDSYATGAGKVGDCPGGGAQGAKYRGDHGKDPKATGIGPQTQPNRLPIPGLKPKDLCMMPARVALALQADGWWLRSEIVWHKPNPMPESVRDRPTKAHEMVYLLTKSAKYFWDQEAVREPQTEGSKTRWSGGGERSRGTKHLDGPNGLCRDGTPTGILQGGRNLRTVWTIPTAPFPEAHFATFPPKLVVPMIKAGTSERGCCPDCGAPWARVVEPSESYAKHLGKGHHDHGNDLEAGQMQTKRDGFKSVNAEYVTIGWKPTCDCGSEPISCTVLDPFAGAGTTGLVASRFNREFIGIEASEEYCQMARNRILADAPPVKTTAA